MNSRGVLVNLFGLILTFFGILHSSAAMAEVDLKECKAKIIALAKGSREQFVLSQNDAFNDRVLPALVKGWGEETCGKDLIHTFLTLLHEDVHMLDFNWLSQEDSDALTSAKTYGSMRRLKFRFYLPSEKRAEIPIVELPMPVFMIIAYFADQKIDRYKEASASFNGFYETYLSRENILVRWNFFAALTEMNAYTHGLKSGIRFAKEFGRRDDLLEQRAGLLFMVTEASIYLTQLERSYPQFYQRISTDEYAKKILAELLNNAAHTLADSEPCLGMADNHVGLFKDFKKFARAEAFQAIGATSVFEKIESAFTCARPN